MEIGTGFETETKDGSQAVYAESPARWREWLQQNHQTEKNIWLILYKKGHPRSGLKTEEAIDQALCFGWIDSKPNKRDADSFYLFFSRRNPKSNWSRVNKENIARLEAEGLLAEAGKAMVELAKQNGTWTALDSVENLEIPGDMQALFPDYPGSAENWEAFPRSAKRGILEWISTAKTAETRIKRIRETLELAAQNIRANQFPRIRPS